MRFNEGNADGCSNVRHCSAQRRASEKDHETIEWSDKGATRAQKGREKREREGEWGTASAGS